MSLHSCIKQNEPSRQPGDTNQNDICLDAANSYESALEFCSAYTYIV